MAYCQFSHEVELRAGLSRFAFHFLLALPGEPFLKRLAQVSNVTAMSVSCVLVPTSSAPLSTGHASCFGRPSAARTCGGAAVRRYSEGAEVFPLRIYCIYSYWAYIAFIRKTDGCACISSSPIQDKSARLFVVGANRAVFPSKAWRNSFKSAKVGCRSWRHSPGTSRWIGSSTSPTCSDSNS